MPGLDKWRLRLAGEYLIAFSIRFVSTSRCPQLTCRQVHWFCRQAAPTRPAPLLACFQTRPAGAGRKPANWRATAPPCSNRETRRVPIEGEPADVVTRIAAYDAWLARSARTFRSCCRPSTAAGTLLIGRDDSLVCGEHRQVEIENCGPARHLAPDDSRSQSPWRSPGGPIGISSGRTTPRRYPMRIAPLFEPWGADSSVLGGIARWFSITMV
jgi:hypothetical protein